MTEIVINRCASGTLFSDAGKAEYLKRKALGALPDPLDHADPVLVTMMKEDRGKRVWAGECSHVEIIAIPDDMAWKIERQGNFEWVAADG